MLRQQSFKCKAHGVFYLTFHVIFVTKFRYHCLTQAIFKDLKILLPQLVYGMEVKILEIKITYTFYSKPHHKTSLAPSLACLSQKAPACCIININSLIGASTNALYGRRGIFVCSTGGAPLEIVKQSRRLTASGAHGLRC